jgi:AcrR family transcriptional regulator
MSTREDLIRTAHDLFYAEGFHTVGLARILDEVGITKTAFYHHFSSKDDLVVESLRWHDRWWQDTFRQMLRRFGGDAPRAQLLALPEVLRELVEGNGYNGCMFVNVAVQFPLLHDPAHQMAAAHKDAMESLLREIAGYAGAADALALAQELAIVLEGGYVTLQVARKMDTIDVVRRVVTDIVERHVPSTGTR